VLGLDSEGAATRSDLGASPTRRRRGGGDDRRAPRVSHSGAGAGGSGLAAAGWAGKAKLGRD
jgi:hypothetical protein